MGDRDAGSRKVFQAVDELELAIRECRTVVFAA
jgi:hypothetical protein